VSINSLHLTDADIGFFDSRARLTPPLRQQRDRDALRAALADGTIDALVSDHTRWTKTPRPCPLPRPSPAPPAGAAAEPGAQVGAGQRRGLARALAVLTRDPRGAGQRAGHAAGQRGPAGRRRRGRPVHVRPAGRCGGAAAALRSQGKHTPFAYELSGTAMPGQVRYTWWAHWPSSALEAGRWPVRA
jgi:dihydroorotase